MHKELADQLINAVKAEIPEVDLTAEQIIRITIITLSTRADFFRKRTAFSNSRLLEYAKGNVEGILTEDGT